MEIIKLNLIPSGATPVVHVKQYDIGRKWRFELYEGAAVYTLDGTEVLECDVKKLDGNIVTISVTNTSSTYVDIETTVQMTACSGDQLGAIRITKGGDDIATINFILACQRSPLEGGITSDSAIHNLEQQIADAVADQYDADSVIFDNTPTQGHGIGFTVTSEGVATAVQDAKDYTDTAIGGLSIPENITDLADTDINNPTNGEIMVYNNGVWENQANPSSTTNFAPDYDDTQTYNTNDKVIYQGLLYVCLEDSITGAWDSTKWQNISVADFTADLLPIESGSATNTKDYIDSGLSGKADTSTTYTKTEVDNKFNLTSGTVTASSNVTIARYTLKKFGNVCFLSVVLYVSVAHSSGAKLAKLSITPTQQVDMIAASKTNEQGVAWYVDPDGYLYTNDAMVTGQTYYLNAWYI